VKSAANLYRTESTALVPALRGMVSDYTCDSILV
jgi:hypothetical protein